MNPEVILLDEPTAGLDPMGVSELMKLLKEIREKTNISVVLSTHDIDLVPIYCDKIYVMGQGKIISEGSPDEVFDQTDLIRISDLRLPRIGHLFEILKNKDNLDIDVIPKTISQARKVILELIKKRE
jgi:cobalt/nickel transport system ATP-binding protein